MKLLIFTQKIDRKDSVLGFFHRWIEEFAKTAESILVICLEKGEYNLPKNVTVYSLGKELGKSKLKYVINFYRYLGVISGSYDRVFVHMNQEYVLLGGLYWKAKNIPVYVWRNHPYGGLLTRLAVALSTKVFCTSDRSFTARYRKTVIMPAGVSTDLFNPVAGTIKMKYSICMVGRIAPIKHVERALEAVHILISSGRQVSLTILGSPLEKDHKYYHDLKRYVEEKNLTKFVSFVDAVPPEKLPEIYSSHEICLNLTDAGSFDKTIVEAASCGSIPVVSNDSLKNLLPEECITTSFPEEIASSIKKVLEARDRVGLQRELEVFVKSQSLHALSNKLFNEIK